MGLFGEIKNNWKKSEAAVIVQNLLENMEKVGMLDSGNQSQLANVMVGRVWDAKPEIFSGAFGQRPHKMLIAAVAFSYAIESFGLSHRTVPVLAFCLGQIIDQVQKNGQFMGLNSSDAFLLEAAESVYRSYAIERLGMDPAKTPN